jgi:diguanylate cyclase (GGDEF)-like protein
MANHLAESGEMDEPASPEGRITEELCATQQADALRPRTGGAREACLVHIYPTGPCMGARYPLSGSPMVIGRAPDCNICIPDNSVSRLHARIEPREDGYHAVDLGSTNGTLVNDVPGSSHLLADGDYLRIGNCIYRFLASGNLEAEYHEEIYRLTIIDALTGVHNRRYLMEFLDHELARAERFGRPLALLLFDIDRFKVINDELGHLAGDLTLRDLAACLQGAVRRDELLARYGGEEFALLLPEADLEQAVVAGDRLRELVEQHPFTCDGQRFTVTISGGVAVTTKEKRLTAAELFRRADEKLYEAKRAGRNRVLG